MGIEQKNPNGGGGRSWWQNPTTLSGLTTVLDSVMGGLGGGEDREQRARELEAQRAMFLQSLNQRREEQGDERGRTAWGMSSEIANLPLRDRAFSHIQNRFALGPASFGGVGAQNDQLRDHAASWQPGRNPSINQLEADWRMLHNRFMATPARLVDPQSQEYARYVGTGGYRSPEEDLQARRPRSA
jgi:hypothetical protein